MNIIAIIPARGGSKRIENKNIRPFAGQPIIAYPIQIAKKSKLFQQIIVSTDSPQVAEIAEEYGASVPFMRPDDLADDHTPTAPVLIHTLKWLEKKGTPADYFCCIYPTTPFLKSEYLKKGFDIIRSTDAITVVSVTSFPAPIFRSLKVRDDGRLEMYWPQHADTRSQDLPAAYHDAGQFYWGESTGFCEQKALFTAKTLPVFLPRNLVCDIDTMEDWQIAEKQFAAINRGIVED